MSNAKPRVWHEGDRVPEYSVTQVRDRYGVLFQRRADRDPMSLWWGQVHDDGTFGYDRLIDGLAFPLTEVLARSEEVSR